MCRIACVSQGKHSRLLLCFVCTVFCLMHLESNGSCAYRRHLQEEGFLLHQLNEFPQGFGVKQVEICSLGKCYESVGQFVLKIPDAIAGYKITHIASGAFAYNQNIVAVEISSNVCQIGRGAFCGCSNIVSVSMADCAFHAMRILGESFKQCVKLEELKLPSGLDLIDVRAFAECNSLKEVRLPDSCNRMVEDAFSNCRSLRSIYIGKVGSHGESRLLSAFPSCPAREEISINSENPAYAILDGALYYKNQQAIVRCPPKHAGKNFLIKDGVSIVCPFAFEGCQFEEIVLPESLGGIGRGAFSGCTNLVSVCFPAGVKVIDDIAFESCSKLRFAVMNGGEMPMMGDDVFPKGTRIIMRSDCSIHCCGDGK